MQREKRIVTSANRKNLSRLPLPEPINALSISSDGELIAVTGREFLKIVSVSRAEVIDSLHSRAGSQLHTTYTNNDVKWGNNATKFKIATASLNGAIVLWDRNRRKAERTITDHSRAVNRVCFQPESGNILLSASQDGTMRCWDLREPRSEARFRFDGKSESVRDVQFNPVTTHEFAAAFDTGTIQKWDIRYTRTVYDRKIGAHSGPCLSIDWHPSGRLLASGGGRDKTIKVWDMTFEGRKAQNCIWSMSSVSRIQWRPGHDYEIASCALSADNLVQVWDIRRPNIAKLQFDEHDTQPSGFAWLNADTLYSCGKDKQLIRQHVDGAFEPSQLTRRDGIGWSVGGDVAFAVDLSDHTQFVDEGLLPKMITDTKKLRRTSGQMLIEDDAAQYYPPQNCGIAHMPLFDIQAFTLLANSYVISGKDIAYACRVNSQLAEKVGRYRTAQTWKIVSLLFTPDQNSSMHVMESINHDKSPSVMETENDPTFPTTQEGSTLPDMTLNVNYQAGHDIQESDDSSESDSELGDIWSPWQHQSVVTDLLEYYTEEGDAQMCTTLYLVLQEYLIIDDLQIESWVNTYLDLLYRFEIWTTATEIMDACPVSRIRERNENAATIHISCNNCFKLVSVSARGAWACDKCKRLLNPCSLCHQTVKGLYVWCQGCNHGGHAEHMNEWFSTETQCATGCGHTCVLTLH